MKSAILICLTVGVVFWTAVVVTSVAPLSVNNRNKCHGFALDTGWTPPNYIEWKYFE